MNIHLIRIIIFFEFLLLGNSQVIQRLYMVDSSNFFNNEREGFLLATLNTGENTTICNYNFAEADANVACATLGYPAQGLSLINSNIARTDPVLLGDISCTGSETNISFCISSGRKVFGAPCSSHQLDTYLYCLSPKQTPIIVPKVVNTLCNSSNGNFNFQPVNNKINTGFLTHESSYVCNDDYGVTITGANILCQLFCTGISNPLPMMFVPGVPYTTSVRVSVQPLSTIPVSCSSPVFALVLQCGNEPTIIETSPNITCDSQSITAQWNAGFIPYINYTFLSIPSCNLNTASIYSNENYDAIININFTNCRPVVSANLVSITYTYTVTRAYLNSGITSISPRNLTISCSFPKAGSSNQNISFLVPTVASLSASAAIPVIMTFYTDSSFQSPMALPYSIFDNQLMYVKVTLQMTLVNLRLGLVNCKVSTVNSMSDTNSTNSLPLLTNSCPNSAYSVAIYPLSRKEIGFQFQPSKIANTNQVFVLCETTKCYMDTYDTNCLYCNSTLTRRKRSAILTEEVVLGPLFILK